MFGRVQGQFSLTASNVAKYDGWHSVIIFDEHHPLRFTAERVADYVDTAQRWAYAAHEADPQACYPFFLWNCLWRSGASILHGHAQMVLTRGMHYAKVESWRQAAVRYQAVHGADYFDDLLAVYHSLGLATDWGQATIFPTLTPFKEKETHIISRNLNADLKAALYLVLHTFVEQLGVQSFNLVLYQPPLAEVDEDWARFPCIIRLIDRGDPNNNRSDIGSMEMFAQSVVTTDPFRVADRLGATISRWRTL
jgi:galactose-1-phosphate uridylyltransferase